MSIYDYRHLLLYMVDEKPENAPMQWKMAWADEQLLRSMKTNDDIVRVKEEELRQIEESFGIRLGWPKQS